MRTLGLPATPRELTIVSVATILPFAASAVLDHLGLSIVGDLLVYGVVACVAATILFCNPTYGVIGMAGYVYAGTSGALPLPVAPPVTAIIATAVMLRLVRGDRNQLVDAPFLWAISIFLMLCVTSMLVAYYPMRSLERLAQLAKVLLLFYLVVQLIRSHRELLWLVYAIVFAEAGGLLLGALLYMTGSVSRIHYIGSYVQLVRFTGLHLDPNLAAGYICATIPFGVFVTLYVGPKWLRIVSAVCTLLLVVGLFSTLSRAAIFAFGLVALAVVGREVRGMRGTVATLTILVVGMLAAPRYYWDRLMSLSNVSSSGQQDWSIHMRLEALETAWGFVRQHPWTGIGLNNFIDRGSHRLLISAVVHNSYLEILVSAGIGALAAFLAVIASGARHAIAGTRHAWRRSPDWMRALSFYAGVSLLTTMASAVFLSLHARYLIWIPLAICLVIGNLMRRDFVPDAEPEH